MSGEPTVFVVDDDAAVRDGLALLLDTAGLKVRTYDGASAFLAACAPDHAGCLILDVRMPEMTGPELQAELMRRGIDLPIIFLTAHGDIPTTVQAIKGGAIDFLTKPVVGAELLDRVRAALEKSAQLRERASAARTLRERLEGLTRREREIMQLVAAGLPNKEIARSLGISHRTVEVHRARVMQKTGVTNLVELSRLAEAAGLLARP
ncbi:MAG TPA: response regulator [Burkholderiaceae bacterium]|jgi:RNA polymerase sigma factor (sigma-70 family)|nr:response regulator [Burkholderiaceae bacterium]